MSTPPEPGKLSRKFEMDLANTEPPPPVPKFYPPARRATDFYIGLGLSGVAGHAWLVTVRVLLNGDIVIGSLYGLFALLVTVAAIGIDRLLILHALGRRPRRPPTR